MAYVPACVRKRSGLQEAFNKKMVDTAVETFGGLHVAFNNAAIFRPATFADITEETMDALIDTNVKSLAWGFKYQVPHEPCSTTMSRAENSVVCMLVS